MWKCKKCGCTRFNIWFRGYMEADFDSIEIVEYHQHTMQLVREDFVECIDCGNRDKKIEKIATWEEEDENGFK